MFTTKKNFIVFDFDGVIVESNEIKYREFFNIFKKNINDITIKEIILSGKDRNDIICSIYNKIYQPDGGSLNINVFIKKYSENVHSEILRIGMNKSIIDFFNKNSKDLFINSATPQKELQLLCEDLCVSNFFLEILGGPNTKEENFKYIFGKYNIKPNQVVFFGDMNSDEHASKIMGVEFSPIFSKGSDLL